MAPVASVVLADEAGWCQQKFCLCDQAAIECLTNATYDSGFRGVAASSCHAANLSSETGSGSGDLFIRKAFHLSENLSALTNPTMQQLLSTPLTSRVVGGATSLVLRAHWCFSDGPFNESPSEFTSSLDLPAGKVLPLVDSCGMS